MEISSEYLPDISGTNARDFAFQEKRIEYIQTYKCIFCAAFSIHPDIWKMHWNEYESEIDPIFCNQKILVWYLLLHI